MNGGQCGVCGDPWQGPRENEYGGKYARGVIVNSYAQGATLRSVVQLTASHYGWFEFRLCVIGNETMGVSVECLQRHLLQLADGTGSRYHVLIGAPMMHHIDLQLPAGLTCQHCVLQWKYNAGKVITNDDERAS